MEKYVNLFGDIFRSIFDEILNFWMLAFLLIFFFIHPVFDCCKEEEKKEKETQIKAISKSPVIWEKTSVSSATG